jgi:hypothetical protein
MLLPEVVILKLSPSYNISSGNKHKDTAVLISFPYRSCPESVHSVRYSRFSIQGEISFCDDFTGKVEAMASISFSCLGG